MNYSFISNYGIVFRDGTYRVYEDPYKIMVVTNRMVLQDLDLRRLKSDSDSKTEWDPSIDKTEAQQSILGQDMDGDKENSVGENSYIFLKKVEQKPISTQYINVLQKDPDQIRAFYDGNTSIYVAVFGQKIIVADLLFTRIDGGSHDCPNIVHVAFFRRKTESKSLD